MVDKIFILVNVWIWFLYLMWAPETQPKICTEIKTANPKVRTFFSESKLAFSLQFRQPEHPKNTSIAVPSNSAKNVDKISDWRTPCVDDLAIFDVISLFTLALNTFLLKLLCSKSHSIRARCLNSLFHWWSHQQLMLHTRLVFCFWFDWIPRSWLLLLWLSVP